MADEWYPLALGKLLANLQSLEFVIRVSLYEKLAQPSSLLSGSLDSVAVGDKVPENPLTDYSSLSQLIARYNETCAPTLEQRVEPSITDLRDALAHGRITAAVGAPHFGIVKFDRPRHGATRVAFAAVLTPDWLREQQGRVAREIRKVVRSRKSESQ